METLREPQVVETLGEPQVVVVLTLAQEEATHKARARLIHEHLHGPFCLLFHVKDVDNVPIIGAVVASGRRWRDESESTNSILKIEFRVVRFQVGIAPRYCD